MKQLTFGWDYVLKANPRAVIVRLQSVRATRLVIVKKEPVVPYQPGKDTLPWK